MLVLDVETTGLDPKKNSIASIGAVAFSNPANQFYLESRIWNGSEILPAALAVNGFSEEALRDPAKRDLGQVVREFLAWAEEIPQRTLAGENPAFDRDFLRASVERCNLKWTFGYRTIDLHSICYTRYLKAGILIPAKDGRSDLNLDKILAFVGMPPEPTPHNALVGAKLASEAFSRLLYSKGLFGEFQDFPLPTYLV